MRDETYTGLVLQGGGALGAYEFGAMKALYERRPGFKPAVITGLSIGSINAAILAGADDPIGTLDKIWREEFAVLAPLPFEKIWQSLVPEVVQQKMSNFGNRGMYSVRPRYLLAPLLAPFFTSSIYDTSPLRETLERVVNLDRLNSGPRVVVTAVDIASGELVRFGNTTSLQHGQPGEFANTDGLTFDHILASSSLPPGFPATMINGRSYWDGGLRSNTPLAEAINCLEAIEPQKDSIKREVIVIELVPMAGPVPQNLQQVAERFLGLIFSSKLALDQALFRKFNGYIELFEALKALLDIIEKNGELRHAIDAALTNAGAMTIGGMRGHPGYADLSRHRRINAFTMIPFKAPAEASHGSDFSRGSIEKRIAAGYSEAVNQDVGEPKWIQP
jgi:NTE family protein